MAVWRLCRRFPVRGIHCGQVLSAGFAAYACGFFTGYPYVHGADLMENRHWFLLGGLIRHILQAAKKVVANSEFTARIVEESGIATETNPSIELSRISRLGDRERRYGWDGRRVLLTIARLVGRRGQDTVIRALPQVIAAVPDVCYASGATGSYRGGLEVLVVAQAATDGVAFTGFVPEDELATMYAEVAAQGLERVRREFDRELRARTLWETCR